MSKTRKCERCYFGTETAVTVNFYTCDYCDTSKKKERVDELDDTLDLDLGWDIFNLPF